MSSPARLLNKFRAVGTNRRLVSLGEHLRTHLKDHAAYGQGPGIRGKPRRLSLPVGEFQLAVCQKVVDGPLEWSAGIQ